MTQKYKIDVLNYDGEVMDSVSGREAAMIAAIGKLQGYRRSCYRASGLLFSNGVGMASRDGLETIQVNGVKIGVCLQFYSDDAKGLIAGFDKRGVEGQKAWCVDLRNEIDAEKDAKRGAECEADLIAFNAEHPRRAGK